ncbi:MAG: hypothetical protein K8I02_06280, partial [Candidatus Methylomirabilis sp.]|nr:hypothetical protein [Deltaproteobacteria bacterium]
MFLGVFVLAAALVLPALFYVANYKARVLEVVRGALARPVWIGGARLDFGEGVGFAFDDVVIQDSEAGRDLLRADRIVVDVSPTRLLRGEIDVTNVALVRPRVFLRRDADGKLSVEGLFSDAFLADLPKSEARTLAERAREFARGPLAQAEFRVEDGGLEFADSMGALTGVLEGVNLALSRQLLLRRVEFDFSAAARAEGASLGTIAVSAIAPFAERETEFPPVEASLEVSSVPLAALVARAGLEGVEVGGAASLGLRVTTSDASSFAFQAALRLEAPSFVAPAIYQAPLAPSSLSLDAGGNYAEGTLDIGSFALAADDAR